MKNNNIKKTEQLGMPFGTASHRLRKTILFSLVKKLKENYCFQCGAEIENEEQLSIEHKVPYLDSEDPKNLFFDLDNIAFSHLNCNIGAAKRAEHSHPSAKSYEVDGCRCDGCKTIQKEKRRKYRAKKKLNIS